MSSTNDASAIRAISRRDFLKVAGVGVAGAALLGAAGCSSGGEGSGSGGEDGLVRTVVIEGTQSFPVKVMQDQGIAEKYGLELETQEVANPEAAYTQMQTSEFQVGFGAWLAIARLREDGWPLTNAYSMYGYTNDVLVRTDSDIEGFADLAGKTVGLFGGPGAGTSIMFRLVCIRFFGFDPLEETNVIFGAPGLLIGQLEGGDLDAALLLDPVIVNQLQTGNFRSVGNIGEIWQEATGENPMLVSLTFNEEWAAANPELAKNFVTAFSEAQEYIKTQEDVWPELANDVDITDPDAVELLRERVGPKLLNIWDEEFIEQQIQFHEQVIESVGSSEEVPSEIPEGTFTTEFVP